MSAAAEVSHVEDPVAPVLAGGGLVDTGPDGTRLDRFLQAKTVEEALRCWLGLEADESFPGDIEWVLDRLALDFARVERMLNEQVNAVLHHPRFQALEASWRGLAYLAQRRNESDGVKLYALNVSRDELARDLERAIEFDQSQFFKKVYSECFDTPGGEPFGVILADYEFHHRTRERQSFSDHEMLRALATVGAAAFAPVIAGADPAVFGANEFSDLGRLNDLGSTFDQLEYVKWHELRGDPDARFVGLTMPRVLMRRPYPDDGSRRDGFAFREEVAGPESSRYLWGTAVYAYGAVLMRAFTDHGWLANIQGVVRGVETGGLVSGLPVDSFDSDRDGIAPKWSTDVRITESLEYSVSEAGFLPLAACPGSEFSAFYASASLQKPTQYDTVLATTNARISSQLRCIFSVSRFAHYVKVIGREKVGSFATAEACREYLRRWLLRYTIESDDETLETKAKSPLRESDVQVTEEPGRPGHYNCTVFLRPHFQLDQLSMALRLVTEIAPEAQG